MQKKSPAFSPEEVLRLAQSPAGQQLLARLRQADPQALERIAALTKGGNLEEASRVLNELLAGPGR